jgi:hypothetical protein
VIFGVKLNKIINFNVRVLDNFHAKAAFVMIFGKTRLSPNYLAQLVAMLTWNPKDCVRISNKARFFSVGTLVLFDRGMLEAVKHYTHILLVLETSSHNQSLIPV